MIFPVLKSKAARDPEKAAMPVGQDDVKKLEERKKDLWMQMWTVKSLNLVGVNERLLTVKKRRAQTWA